LILGLVILAAVLLFTPYEAVLEVILAVAIVAAVGFGFMLRSRRDIFYVRTSVRLIDADRNQALEHDYLAVKVELTRLWLLFLPTFLAVGFLAVSSGGGLLWKLSLLNGIFSSRYAYIPLIVGQWPLVIVLALLAAWISEKWVLRDAEACSARSFSVTDGGRVRQVSYSFMGEHGEYYGGDCLYFGLVRPMQLATVVFHNVRNPDVNKIAMGFLFNRLIILGRGVTDLDKQTVAAQTLLSETTP
jgi:hypothetical protein